jgi:hypothetical protein
MKRYLSGVARRFRASFNRLSHTDPLIASCFMAVCMLFPILGICCICFALYVPWFVCSGLCIALVLFTVFYVIPRVLVD